MHEQESEQEIQNWISQLADKLKQGQDGMHCDCCQPVDCSLDQAQLHLPLLVVEGILDFEKRGNVSQELTSTILKGNASFDFAASWSMACMTLDSIPKL